MVADKATGKPKCVYCDELDPSSEHLATHNHATCYEKGPESRTFYRKDHLRQHLRLMHGCKMTTSMETWKSEAQYIRSRCGFCGQNFDKWQERVDHLAKEFRNGASMSNWKGCRGLDPHVAIHVTNAMPPYLIANESKSPFPFSASNSSSLKVRTASVNTRKFSKVKKHHNASQYNSTNSLTAATLVYRKQRLGVPLTQLPWEHHDKRSIRRIPRRKRPFDCWTNRIDYTQGLFNVRVARRQPKRHLLGNSYSTIGTLCQRTFHEARSWISN